MSEKVWDCRRSGIRRDQLQAYLCVRRLRKSNFDIGGPVPGLELGMPEVIALSKSEKHMFASLSASDV